MFTVLVPCSLCFRLLITLITKDQFAVEILIVKPNLILAADSSDSIIWQLQIILVLSVYNGTF